MCQGRVRAKSADLAGMGTHSLLIRHQRQLLADETSDLLCQIADAGLNPRAEVDGFSNRARLGGGGEEGFYDVGNVVEIARRRQRPDPDLGPRQRLRHDGGNDRPVPIAAARRY